MQFNEIIIIILAAFQDDFAHKDNIDNFSEFQQGPSSNETVVLHFSQEVLGDLFQFNRSLEKFLEVLATEPEPCSSGSSNSARSPSRPNEE